ncbi:helix-turn-helix transcriptional regulator [Novosphingobium percolationis]|uniref:helix-turn-helix transcriptional regulator n=1 Tax=Novosphingobium percolationis TaxID=2871811 RepID=UPI00384C55A8
MMEASHPTRLCRWSSTNIKPADSRYDRGTSGGQVTTRLLRIEDVMQMTSLSRSYIYALAARDQFPKPLSLGRKCSRWREADVLEWIGSRS